MRLLGLVACRTGSSRLPGKAFRELGGVPLLGRVLDRVTAGVAFGEVVVCTTVDPADDAIEEYCAGRGVAVHRGPVEDVLGRFLGAMESRPSEYVARITGDNPLSDVPAMLGALGHLERTGGDYSRPDGVPLGCAIEVARADALRELHERTLAPELTEYMTWFFELAPFVRCELWPAPDEVRFPDLRLTVDLESDLAFLERVLAHFGGVFPPLPEIVAYCRTLDDAPRVARDPAAEAAVRDRIRFA
ncbi:MAG: acylneuraminate cytidylyltransferase [Actinobacteria bacterium]|nr:MAG: acylneuraminate cytidylyltransferase [Actinomycetota bacterium]